MKRVLVVLLTIVLSSCGQSATQVKAGRVISCSTISHEVKWVGGPEVECLDGNPGIQLSALRGPMVVNVWGSWCTPCEEELPFFREFYEIAKGKVELVGVAVEEAKPSDAQNFVVAQGITWPNLIDIRGASRSYFGMGVPVTWFINTDGSVAYKKVGVINSADELFNLTDKYLGIKLL